MGRIPLSYPGRKSTGFSFSDPHRVLFVLISIRREPNIPGTIIMGLSWILDKYGENSLLKSRLVGTGAQPSKKRIEIKKIRRILYSLEFFILK